MKQLFTLAIRDLARNRRRSFFSALALGMGVAVLLLMAAVVEGEMRDTLDRTIILQSGHMQVQNVNFNPDKNSLAWDDLVAGPERIAEQIGALPEVKTATPRLYASGILNTGDKSTGVQITGIDPESSANDPYRLGMVSGDFLQADDRSGILVGEALATTLSRSVGDQVALMVNTSSGDVAEQNFTIRGVYSTGTPAYDRSNVFMPLSKAQAISQTEGYASTIFILLNKIETMPAVSAALKTEQYKISTYEAANQMIIETEALSQAFMIVLYLIVLAITATVIVNTLVMAVFERTREIGILAALGMRSRTIMSMFFIESAILAIGGTLIGLFLGGLLVLYSSTVGFYIGDFGATGFLLGERIYGYLTVEDTVTLSITALVVTLVASIYPAVLAARMQPVEALHGGK